MKALLALVGTGLMIGAVSGDTGWRGNSTGKFPEAKVPQEWSTEKHVIWSTELPAWSNAAPIVVKDRLFMMAEPGSVLCVSAKSGELLWKKDLEALDVLGLEDAEKAEMEKRLEGSEAEAAELRDIRKKKGRMKRQMRKEGADKAKLQQRLDKMLAREKEITETMGDLVDFLPPSTHGSNGFTSAVPTSDGEKVYVLLGSGIAAAFDLDGKQVWARTVPKPNQRFGHSASPLLVKDRLILHIGDKVMAISSEKGETIWVGDAKSAWGSPVLGKAAGKEAVFLANGDVLGISDGTVLATGLTKLVYNAPVIEDGHVYYIQNGGKAFKIPTEEGGTFEEVWSTSPKNDRYYASPVVHEGLIYAVTRYGGFSVIDAKTGEVKLEREVEGGGKATFYPSFLVLGGQILMSRDDGMSWILKPEETADIVQTNKLEAFRSTPLVVGDRMYIRGLKKLYCIGAN